MDSAEDLPCGRGCPIRRSRDQRSLASPPGFSQRATSFIASWRQGIHQMPLTLTLDHEPVARRDKTRDPTDPLLAQTLMRADDGWRMTEDGRPPTRSHHAARLLPLHPVKDQTDGHEPTGNSYSFPIQTPRIEAHPAPAVPEHRCRSGHLLRKARGGGERDRTDDLLLAKQALSQLSYTPGTSAQAIVRTAPAVAQATAEAAAAAQTPAPRRVPLPRCESTAGAATTLRRWRKVVGQGGFEPPTSRLSSARSNQLSY